MKGRGIKSALFSAAPQKGGKPSILTGGFMGEVGQAMLQQQPVLRANMSNPGQTLPLRSDSQGLLKLSGKKIQLKLPVTQLIQPGQHFPQLASKCSFAKKKAESIDFTMTELF